SKVLPVEDMPYLSDGTAVDMVLNPLGVPSRMNIGQILEVHLGWAAHGLGQQLSKYIEHFKADEARKSLTDAFEGDEEMVKTVQSADDDSIKKMLRTVRHGIHVATPVFDGAKEKDVKSLLSQAKMPLRGQTTLFDGRTGEPFQNNVTVGVMYMLKLHH